MNEISWRHSATGKTVYCTIRSAARTYWNTDTDLPALEALTVANWYNAAVTSGNYWIAMVETPASSYFYVGTWPVLLTTHGWYWLDIYEQVGVTPAISDTLIGGIIGYWNGATFSPWDANVIQVAGTVQTAGDLSAQLSTIGSGTGAALNFAADADNTGGALKGVSFVGSQTLTFSVTSAEDLSRHSIADSGVAPDIDIVYRFSIGAGRNAAKVVWKGTVTSGDTVTVQAYNGATWDTRATIPATGANNVTRDIPLLAQHTGTGADAGLVYIRFTSTGMTNITLATDELLVAGVSVGMSIGYADGAIWVKAAGTAGTTPHVHGTADNPCPWANAQTIATTLGLTRFRILNGETVTLIDDAAGKSMIGKNWTLALGGGVNKSIAASYIEGATVSGESTGDSATFFECTIGTATIGTATFHDCRFTGSLTTVANKNYTIHFCVDGLPGTGTNPIFLMAASVSMGFRAWSGGVDLQNMVATDTVVLDGWGRLLLHGAAGTTGTVIVRGHFDITDHCTGGFGAAIEQTERYASSTVQTAANAALEALHLDHLLAVDYDPTAKPGVATALLNEIIGSDAGVSQFTANALELAPVASVAGLATATNVTDAVTSIKGTDGDTLKVLSEQIDDLPTNTELGTALGTADDAVLAAITALPTDSDVQAAAAAALTAYGPALETTLTAIKGAGWTTETLKAIDVLLDAIKAKTDTIGALSVTVTSPVASDGEISVLRGDDYLLADNRELSFTGTGWPVITGGTVSLRVALSTVTAYAGVVTGAAACYVPLTAAQTTAMTPGAYPYDLEITLANGHVFTPEQGTLVVTEDVR